MDTLIVGAGIACIVAAVVGGGLRAFQMEIPLLASAVRQVLLFAVGSALLAIGLIGPLQTGAGVDDGAFHSTAEIDVPTVAATTSAPEATKIDTLDQDKNRQAGGGAKAIDGHVASRSDEGKDGSKVTVISASSMGPLEFNTNRNQSDLERIPHAANNPEECANLCRDDPRCAAMTFVRSQGACWLKYTKPEPTTNPDMVSAVKVQSGG